MPVSDGVRLHATLYLDGRHVGRRIGDDPAAQIDQYLRVLGPT